MSPAASPEPEKEAGWKSSRVRALPSRVTAVSGLAATATGTSKDWNQWLPSPAGSAPAARNLSASQREASSNPLVPIPRPSRASSASQRTSSR